MKKGWVSVKLSEASIRVDCSDVSVTFGLSLGTTQKHSEIKKLKQQKQKHTCKKLREGKQFLITDLW